MHRTHLWLALLLVGCLEPGTGEHAGNGELHVLGVLAEPPEAAPGTAVQLTLLLADDGGPVESAPVVWTLCSTPRALSEPGFASQACIRGDDPPLPERALSVALSLPPDACTRFGGADDADLRPRDADLTGGYYQPLRAALDAHAWQRAEGVPPVLARLRMQCPLRDAPIAIAQAYAERYRPNQAPEILSFEVDAANDGLVPASAEIELRVRVRSSSLERYVTYERGNQRLATRTETLTAAWFANGGELLETRSAVGLSGEARTVLRTPQESGPVQVWVMVRDDRGAMSHRLQRLRIGS